GGGWDVDRAVHVEDPVVAGRAGRADRDAAVTAYRPAVERERHEVERTRLSLALQQAVGREEDLPRPAEVHQVHALEQQAVDVHSISRTRAASAVPSVRCPCGSRWIPSTGDGCTTSPAKNTGVPVCSQMARYCTANCCDSASLPSKKTPMNPWGSWIGGGTTTRH